MKRSAGRDVADSRNRHQRSRHASSDSPNFNYPRNSHSSEISGDGDESREKHEEDDATYLRRKAEEARKAQLRSVHEPTPPMDEPRSLTELSSRAQSARHLR